MISKSLYELAQLVQGEILGDGSLQILGVADLDSARKDEITFLANIKKQDLLKNSNAGAVVVSNALTEVNKPAIVVKDPVVAIAIIHNTFLLKPFHALGVSEQAYVGKDCDIPSEVFIGPMSVLGDRVKLGQRVTIKAGVVVGDDVIIGDDTILHPNVTVYNNCTIGKRVIVHGGTVIGADGFGYATNSSGVHIKRPHVGTVQIDDDVELGANVCVDRATFGVTRIRAGVKIDNLVQVAHNVDVGENSLIVAQAGIAGSTTLGRNVVLGGQVGIAGHIRLGDRTMVGAQSGVHNNQKPGTTVSGTPAISHKKWLRASVAVEKIPDLIKDVRELKNQMNSKQDIQKD